MCMNYIHKYIQYVHIYIYKYCPILSISSCFQDNPHHKAQGENGLKTEARPCC